MNSEKVVFFTCCNKKYEYFACMYAFSVLFHNEDAVVEVGLESVSSFLKKYKGEVDFIRRQYGEERFIIRDVLWCTNKGAHIIPNSVRFLNQPVYRAEYVYIGDVDIIILESDIKKIHLDRMSKTGLAYSNSVRPGTQRLSGLHFSEFDALYPLPDISDIDITTKNDELLLYQIVKRKKLLIPKSQEWYRPTHGIHASPNRDPVGDWFRDKPIPGWGINHYIQQFKVFSSSDEFREYLKICNLRVFGIIAQIMEFESRKTIVHKSDIIVEQDNLEPNIGYPRKVPNFLVIGSQKSGTTWLYKHFLSRSDVYVPKNRKEIAFFDVQKNYEFMGENGYFEYFSESSNEIAIGEVTPSYLWVSNDHKEWGSVDDFRNATPRRVIDTLGAQVKLIALLRNPIDRAISGFLHHKKKGRISNTSNMRDVWQKHGILHMGFYNSHLEVWGKIFPKENFLVLTYESFFSEKDSRVALCNFLSIPIDGIHEAVNKTVHAGLGFVRDENSARDYQGHVILTNQDISYLRSIYHDDVKKLHNTWNVDTSQWNPDFSENHIVNDETKCLDEANIFGRIFEENRWHNSESVSGSGSTLKATRELVPQLLGLIDEFQINRFLDIPCGDFNWIKPVAAVVPHYMGGDIVPKVVDLARRRASDLMGAEFELINLITDILPVADMIMSRDCLVHLDFELGMSAIKNICQSNIKWLLITTFPDVENNKNVKTGSWRPLNMERPPFSFPKPEVLIIERPSLSPNLTWGRKALGLWMIASLKN